MGDYEIDNPSLFLIVDGKVEVFFNQRVLRTLEAK